MGQLIALADALRSGSLNPAQAEIMWALREGLGQLEIVKTKVMMDTARLFASAEIV